MKFSKYHALGNDLLKNSPSRSRDRKFDMHVSLLKSPPPLEGGAWGGGRNL